MRSSDEHGAGAEQATGRSGDTAGEVAVRVVVTGGVQGVGYRSFACRYAQRLGLRGHVRNLADGGVEVVAAGPRLALDQFLERLREGPPGASVREVRVSSQALSAVDGAGFAVRY